MPAFVQLKTVTSQTRFVVKKKELAKQVAKTASDKIDGSISIILESSAGQKVIVAIQVLVLISRVDLDEFEGVTTTKAPAAVDPRNFTATISKINAFGEVYIDFNASLDIQPDLPASRRHLLRMSEIDSAVFEIYLEGADQQSRMPVPWHARSLTRR